MTAAALVLALFLRAPCHADDAPCLRVELLEETERADRLEERVDLLKESLVIAEKIGAEERARADRWKDVAEDVGRPPAWYEKPTTWGAVGFGAGVLTVLGILFAVR